MTDGDRDDLLDMIVQWEEAAKAGRHPRIEDLCADRPHLLDALRTRIEQLRRTSWMDRPVEDHEGPSAGPEAHIVSPPLVLAGRYRLDEQIGRGGFGRVYRGFDTTLQRTIAVKVFDLRVGYRSGPVEAYLEEAKKLAQFHHPGVVPVHDAGRDGDHGFLVTDLIDGADLATELRSGPPTFVEAARITAEVARILQRAHESGFVHRDLKPANILLDRTGRVFLTDFGIAIKEGPLSDEMTTGTLPYMAPEQLEAGNAICSPRSDLYSLGVVLFEMLTGRRPYRAPTPKSLQTQIRSHRPSWDGAGPTAVPAELRAICDRCLASEPNNRPASARDLEAELCSFLSRHPSSNFAWSRRSSKRRSRALLLGTLLFGAAAFFEVGRRTQSHQEDRLSDRPQSAGIQPPGASALKQTAIDLLALIDPGRDAVESKWRRESGGVLLSSPDPISRIVIPFHPPREYVLRIVMQRKKGKDAVVVGLVVGESQVAAVMDTGPGIVSGLELLDGAPLRNQSNESRLINYKGVIPPIGKECTIICTVRESGVLVTCNGETIIDCLGGPRRFEVPDYWAIPDRRALFLGSMNGVVAFERVELFPLVVAGRSEK